MKDTELNILEKLESALQSQTNIGVLALIQRARKPLTLLGLSFVGGVLLLSIGLSALFEASQPNVIAQAPQLDQSVTRLESDTIYVDLSGSVTNPSTYKLKAGTRLFELIELAGGFSPEADTGFIQRNYNLAVILNDQQKVHIPSIFEVREGKYSERNKLVTLEMSTGKSTRPLSIATNSGGGSSLISLNTSTLEELKVLPGVGDVIGQQIMAGRPYAEVNDLLTKGIVKQSLYDKIVQMLEP